MPTLEDFKQRFIILKKNDLQFPSRMNFYNSQNGTSLFTMKTFAGTTIKNIGAGSGCGAVGRTVASDTRDAQYKSSHQQFNCYRL